MTHISLNQPHLSIKQLNNVKLPDFTVLIGRNGVGKTQLLQAIKHGAVTVAGIETDEIELFDLESFKPSNSGSANWGASSFAAMTANWYLLGDLNMSPVETAREIYSGILDEYDLDEGSERHRDFEKELRDSITGMQNLGDFPNIRSSTALESYASAIRKKVLRPLRRQATNQTGRNRRTDPNELNSKNDPATLITLTMKLHGKLPHEICRNDIILASNFEGNTIDNSISEVFARYKFDQFLWAHTEGEVSQQSFQYLMKQFRDDNKPPWEVLAEILDKMREGSDDPELFNFEFSDPENDKITFGNHLQYTFESRMTNRATGDSYPVMDLSSGEKIMMTLFLATFNHKIGRDQPKLVLFDEVDSVLHPSMISALIIGIKDLFVKNGTRVIIATHSVTTVAMLEEGEIYRIVRDNNIVSVSSVTKSEAIIDLSEGIATIDTGLRIAVSTAAPITILSEGKNSLHLKKWASLFFPDEVEVFDQLPDKTSKSQLKTYGLLLSKMNTNSHFLIVWDCDSENTARELKEQIAVSGNVTAFSFSSRTNSIVSKGIENKYDETILEPFSNRVLDASDREIARSFENNRKAQFASHVFDEGDETYFQYFDDLDSTVKSILNRIA